MFNVGKHLDLKLKLDLLNAMSCMKVKHGGLLTSVL